MANTMSATQRREAVRLALSEALEPEDARSALRLWDSGFADSPSINIIAFVAETAGLIDLSTKQRHDLRRALYHFLLKSGTQADSSSVSDPVPPAAPDREPETPAPTQTRPSWVVFVCMVTNILAGVHMEGSDAMQEFSHSLRQRKKKVRVSEPLDRAFVAWSAGQVRIEALETATDADLARLFHAVYVATAEAIGPVEADRLLTRCINEAESLPEARLYPPRNFL
ncbi:hypothetical protein [Imhoffiella purpurea]|uniref:Uncharacterized protein n=1 Tax=Imhoffiella purpurea TaxID=1249627 RepID=W9VLT0_9GAMM|nr:hypothetical protein [Imhoffiella purpurea]EXJ17062.1 hypothetical protein D779_0814 [Imhoffiella purpurea]